MIVLRLATTSLIALLASKAVLAETLFKIVTVKDEVIIGLNDAELAELGGDAGGIAKEIAAKGTLSVWQYGQRFAAGGEREMAPVAKIGLLANNSLRVEPYKQPFKVLPHAVAANNEDGQKPAVAQDDTPSGQPKECITDKTGYRSRDGSSEFYVELINACNRPQSCTVKAYVVGSEGGRAGSGTLTLPAAADGIATHETWSMQTAQMGGMATVSRSCTPE
jgi:hypothetical protein